MTTGRPRGPSDKLICAIGDIHGQLGCLERLLARIDDHLHQRGGLSNHLIFLGDYIDRGRETRALLDYLIDLGEQRSCVFLRGNHEQVLLDFLDDPDAGKAWIRFGGLETLASYGVGLSHRTGADIDWPVVQSEFARAFPIEHRAFLESTEYCCSAGDFFFVHAGIDPKKSFTDQSAWDLMTVRRRFLGNDDIRDKVVVHGHSHVTKPEIKRNRIGIDTGAYATNVLSSVMIWNELITFVDSKN